MAPISKNVPRVGTLASSDLTGSTEVAPMSLEAYVVVDAPAADGLGFGRAAGAAVSTKPSVTLAHLSLHQLAGGDLAERIQVGR